jgi:allophanate hydrolase subunit 2
VRDQPQTAEFEILATGPLSLLQDAGRPGFAHLGVTASGAADRASYADANRLAGNRAGAAVIETTFGGLMLRVRHRAALLAVTGAPVTVTVHRPSCDRLGLPSASGTAHPGVFEQPSGRSLVVFPGDTVAVGAPESGLRVYLAVRGGFEAPKTLGSRSTDVLSGLGPPPLAAGDRIGVGSEQAGAHSLGSWPAAEFVRAALVAPTHGEASGSGGGGAGNGNPRELQVIRGPRDDLFGDTGWAALLATAWTADAASNRVGVRLATPGESAIRRLPGHDAELPSEGMVPGAVQVPPNGQPVVFLRDHPVTGGYPVIGVLVAASIDAAAQLRPGDPVRFTERRA